MDMSRAIPNEESAAADSPTHQAATPSVRLPIGQIENVWAWIEKASEESSHQPIVNLGLGYLEFNPPKFMIEAHETALRQVDTNQYGPTSGFHRLKQTLSNQYGPFYKRELDIDQEISIHTGGTEAILSCIAAFVNPGDEVIILEPAFNLYQVQLFFMGACAKSVSMIPPQHDGKTTTSANEWSINIEAIRLAITAKTKMLIINTPHNPLGKIFTKDELAALGNICIDNDLLIVSDEVYEYSAYIEFPRIATLDPKFARRTLTVGSAGKTFNATGWRVGWVIGDATLMQHVMTAHILLSYTTAGPAQLATAAGFEEAEAHDFWESNRKRIIARSKEMDEVLQEIGLPYFEPSGAYFIFVDTRKLKLPQTYHWPPHVLSKPRDWKLAWLLIMEHGLVTVPGSAFYSPENADRGENFLRIITCKSAEGMVLAKERLRELRRWM